MAPNELARASGRLSERYRAGDFSSSPLDLAAARAAYLAVRLPATFASNAHVFARLGRAAPWLVPSSLLDLGAGPGTAAWAAADAFPSIQKITLMERDHAVISLGKRLAERNAAFRGATWLDADLSHPMAFEKHDLVAISYALGELSTGSVTRLITSAWDAARVLVIVEPGTPKGFARVLEVRNAMISAGASLIAPCPHHEECPLAAAGDWCHFAERVERSAIHRRVKSAALGYEDEKFSFVVAARDPVVRPAARIVRHPQVRGGHIQLELCTAEGLQHATITRSQKELYRAARKARWGDAWKRE